MIGKTKHSLKLKIGNIGSTRIPQCFVNHDLNKIIKLSGKIDNKKISTKFKNGRLEIIIL